MNITILGSINSGFFWRSCFLTISGHGELSNLLMSTLPHCSHFVGIKVCRVRLRNPGLSMTVMTVRVAGVALLAFFLPALAAQEECDDSLLACCVLQLGRARSILWWCISIYIYIHIMICIYIYIYYFWKSLEKCHVGSCLKFPSTGQGTTCSKWLPIHCFFLGCL